VPENEQPLVLPEADITDEPLVCFAVNRDWIPIISGALSPMANLYNWQYDTDFERKRIEANNATLDAILVDAGDCVGCIDYRNSEENPNLVEVSCDGGETWRDGFFLNGSPANTLTRYNDDGHKEISSDGGETWVNDDENDPRFTSPTGETDETGNAACKAATNITNRASEIAQEVISILTSTPTLVAIVFGITTFIAALISFPVAIPFVVAFVTVIVTYTVEQIEEALDETAFAAFKSIIYCEILNNPVGSQGKISLANWDGIVAQVRAQFTGVAALYFEMFCQVMGSSGLVILGRLGANDGTGCDEFDCGNFVFRLFGDEPDAWGSYEIVSGEYDLGQNKIIGSLANGSYDAETFTMDAEIIACAETTFTLTRVIVYYHVVVSNPFSSRQSHIRLGGEITCSPIGEFVRMQNVSHTGSYIMDSGLLSVDVKGVDLRLAIRSIGSASDVLVFDRVEIHGEGENPFNTD